MNVKEKLLQEAIEKFGFTGQESQFAYMFKAAFNAGWNSAIKFRTDGLVLLDPLTPEEAKLMEEEE